MQIPSEKSYSVLKMCEGYELDFIAKDIMACTDWNVVTKLGPDHGLQPDVNKGSRVWQAKMRLAELSSQQWEGKLQATIDNLTETIQAIANHLWSPLGGITTSGEAGSLTTLHWHVLVDTSLQGNPKLSKIEMGLVREYADGRGSWKAKRKEIAATLCLWMSGFERQAREGSGKRNNLWLLSASDDGGVERANDNGDMGRILSDWWISRETNRIEIYQDGTSLESSCERYNVDRARVLDCVFAVKIENPGIYAEFPPVNTQTRPAFITQTSLLEMCAQYLLSNFISFAACWIDPIESNPEIRVVGDERSLTITNDSIRGLTETVQRFGLATMEEAYRIIVPALSAAHKLPRIARQILRLVKEDRRGLLFRREAKSSTTKVQAEEFYRLVQSACTDEVNTLISQNQWREAGGVWRELKDTFLDAFGPTNPYTPALGVATQNLCEKLICADSEPTHASQTDDGHGNLRDTGEFPLHNAVRSTRAPDVCDAIRVKNKDPNSIDDKGQTPLHLAATLGGVSIIQLLLFFGACPNVPDTKENRTALHFSIDEANDKHHSGRSKVVALLLQNGAEVNARDRKGNTALIAAAERGYEGLVVLLVENKADLNARNGDGDSAILLGAKGGYEAVVEYLVKNRVDVNTPNKNGDTALLIAAQLAHGSIVKQLVSGGARMDLGLAAEKGYMVVLELLIGGGGVGGILKDELDAAICLAAANGHERVVEFLLGQGADLQTRDKEGNTLLIRAAASGHHSVVELLLSNGVDVNSVGENNNTALLATGGEYERVAELLIKQKADLNARNKYNFTVLHLAILNKHERVVKLLVDSGADIHVRDDDSSTPLHLAAGSGVEALVRLVMAKRPDLDAQDVNGDTALLIAIQGCHVAVVKFLVEEGADVNVANNENLTAIQWASHHEDKAMKQLLRDHGAVSESS